MNQDDKKVLEFLGPQIRDHGGNVEIDQGLWSLFAVESADEAGNAIARSLLANVGFAHDSGASADDKWVLYYVDNANRADAIHWLEDLTKLLAGEIRPPSPAHRATIQELAGSNMPHRVAQRLADLHGRGEVGAGIVREPPAVRTLLDRLHVREPLFFSAFQILLANHLIDMVVLLQQIIPEDVSLENEIVKASLSRDPFLQSRQTAATETRNLLMRFNVISPLDQQKNTAINNPYAAYLEVVRTGEKITASVDGNNVTVLRRSFVSAIHSVRRCLYRGDQFGSLDTQAPWMTEEIAYSFRFIKQRLEVHRELPPIDGLYMLERAVAD